MSIRKILFKKLYEHASASYFFRCSCATPYGLSEYWKFTKLKFKSICTLGKTPHQEQKLKIAIACNSLECQHTRCFEPVGAAHSLSH